MSLIFPIMVVSVWGNAYFYLSGALLISFCIINIRESLCNRGVTGLVIDMCIMTCACRCQFLHPFLPLLLPHLIFAEFQSVCDVLFNVQNILLYDSGAVFECLWCMDGNFPVLHITLKHGITGQVWCVVYGEWCVVWLADLVEVMWCLK